ncbi:class I SAM-dependent methyltransferase [Salinarimonas rosea]|uniref:class I SAM-dependent methyltransferase n=1 Tax=Salinarimonas rosea TaxID=552063 RepID=UPI0004204CA5|nr:class I SAM-dependent methyltransferase [Salinarimonas rosea]
MTAVTTIRETRARSGAHDSLVPIERSLRAAVALPLGVAVRRRRALWEGRSTRRRLRGAVRNDARPLGRDDLHELLRRYERPRLFSYSAEDFVARGEERAAFLDALPAPSGGWGARRSLEIGCMDGMVSAGLARRGWDAIAIDPASDAFDQRARDAGASLRCMHAEALDLPDDSIDLAFSYDAFEHVADPAVAFREVLRVVRPGGLVYLNFGPLYNSRLGLHAYRQIPIPFCQFLFDRETLDAYCRENELRPIKYEQLNGWSLARFRALWREERAHMRPLRYVETFSSEGMDLVERYPELFRRDGLDYEELACENIEALFEVRS